MDYDVQDCELCGERLRVDRWGMYLDEVGEFDDPEKPESVVAHAQCGIDAGFELA